MNKSIVAAAVAVAAVAGVGTGVIAYNVTHRDGTTINQAGNSPSGSSTTPGPTGSTAGSGTTSSTTSSSPRSTTSGPGTSTSSTPTTSGPKDTLAAVNVMGKPSFTALGWENYEITQPPSSGDGQAPVVTCQKEAFANLGATAIYQTQAATTIQLTYGTVGLDQIAAEFGTAADTARAVKTVRGWIDTCNTWGREQYLAGIQLDNPRTIDVTGGTATWWHMGGTDHQAAPLNSSIALIVVGNRITLVESNVAGFLTTDGSAALVRRAAQVLGA